MSVPNTRIVVVGAPRADREFTVCMIDKREAQRLAEELARNAGEIDDELKRDLQKFATGR